jgi:DNA invertase Pin-like site-specific DNA recombinase
MIGVYLRVSTKDQDTRSQRAEIEQYIKANGIADELVTWYEDQETGTTLKRPEFDRLQGDIFAGKVKTVIVNTTSRTTRVDFYCHSTGLKLSEQSR